MLTAPVAYQIVTVIEAQFLTPFLVGRRLEMNAVAALPTVVLWGWLWGVDGALLAAPFLVAFKVICENFDGLGRVDKRDSQDVLNVIQAGICDGDQLGTRPDV